MEKERRYVVDTDAGFKGHANIKTKATGEGERSTECRGMKCAKSNKKGKTKLGKSKVSLLHPSYLHSAFILTTCSA